MKTILAAASLAALAFASAVHAFFIPPQAYVYEYVNEVTGHYVLLDQSEAALVDRGSAGPAWSRTGYQFEVFAPGEIAPEQQGVCRFYSPIHNSHFFTGNAAECDFLRTHPNEWIYEKIAFTVYAVPSPQCGVQYKPVYRLFNGRVAQHDANHRFTPDAQVRDQMVAQGWKDEGVAFCTTFWWTTPMKTFDVRAKTIKPTAQCESQVGPCVALKQLAPMPNLIYSFFPPFYVNKNPDYPLATQGITGVFTDLFTAQPVDNAAAVASHSFVQAYATGGPPYGIHIVSSERIAGPYAAISPMYQMPGAAPAAGGVDERLFPWKGLRHHTLVAWAVIGVPTIRQEDPSSHAYGGLVMQFGDASTGRSFLVTVQAYSTLPPGDFVARDADTGMPIVSTVFRQNPAFGSVIDGEFAPCTSGARCIDFMRQFRFRMTDEDFAKALRAARTLDPNLSGDVASYFVGQFRFQNETFGAAELGANVQYLALDLWY